jgi:uncharacterized protein YkwD
MHRSHVGGLLVFLAGAVLPGVALLLAPAARADPAAMINALRAKGCAGRPPAGLRVERNDQLDTVAEGASHHELGDAIELADYPAAKAVAFHTKGSADDASIRRVLAARDCDAVSDPQYEEIGVFRRKDELWIVLARRKHPPPPIALEPNEVAERVLELVNAARAEARSCGAGHFEAAPPLTLSATLTEAALLHARDMAQRRTLSHEGGDGSTSAERIARFGQPWLGSGENVAAGQRTPEAVVAAWLESPGHCVNLMEPRFTKMGVAFALTPEPDDNPPIYWSQELGLPP